MIAPARVAAYQAIQTVRHGRADLATAMAQVRASLGDDRDRALASEIASGVFRRLLTLDHLIVRFANRPQHTIDAEVLDILRIAAYQLLHLSRVPASAVVDDAVMMSRKYGKSSASGFVNAVLRTLSRSRADLPLPVRPSAASSKEDWINYFVVVLSHPRWLVERWVDRLGVETAEKWMLFNDQPAPLTLRVNRRLSTVPDLQRRLADEGVPAEPGRYSPDALRVDAHAAFRGVDLPPGLYAVQDEASQLVARLVGPRPGRLVLDTCAAPGGKATAIALRHESERPSTVVACDVRSRRMSLLSATVAAVGVTNVRLVQADAMRPLPFAPHFNSVIVDAPCSGLGTLRRDPDIKWRRQESDFPSLAAAQVTMLHHAAGVVAPGGRLIYATCSTEPEENEDVVRQFLEQHGEYHARHAAEVDPTLASVVDDEGRLRTTPDRHQLEGFFGAVFERAT